MGTGLVERLGDLAVDVELQLRRGGVADPHRPRPLVAGQPLELPLVEAPLAGDPVHDLQLAGIAGDRPQQPLAPRLGLVAVARPQHREQRQRRVAEPAEAVVPVATPPIASGSDVVGAATMPPVGAYVSALSTSSDWWISSW